MPHSVKSQLLCKFPQLSLRAINVITEFFVEFGAACEDEPDAKYCCEALLDQNTPYGPLIEVIDLPLEGGECHKWSICNPFALLFVLCGLCCKFAKFLQEIADYSSGVASMKLIYYTDEETPGNQLRPDNSRKTQCHYWTFKEFPAWFRTRCEAWMVLGYLNCDIEAEVKGCLSGVLRKTLTRFLARGSFNFIDGCLLPDGSGSHFHLRATFGFFLQDFNAFVASCCLKGATALKPCPLCKNTIQTEPHKITDPYYKHIGAATPADFDRHTAASYWEQRDIRNAACEGLPANGTTQRTKIEKFMGMRYEPDGLENDLYLRTVIDPIHSKFFDSMHCVTASGGIGQYHINHFCLAIVEETDWTLEQIDNWWNGRILWTDEAHCIKKGFFESRVAGQGCSDIFLCLYKCCLMGGVHVHRQPWKWPTFGTLLCIAGGSSSSVVGACLPTLRLKAEDHINAAPGAGQSIKAFSGETISAIRIMSLFAQLVLIPNGQLVQHCKAFLLLAVIVDMFLDEALAVNNIDFLDQIVLEHFRLILQIYGRSIMKVKPHLLFHILESIRFWGVAPNCSVCERCHQVAKKIAHNVKRHDLALLRRSLLYSLSRFMGPDLDFESSHRLINARPLPQTRKRHLKGQRVPQDRWDEWPFTDPEFKMSRRLRTDHGRINCGVLVKIVGSDGGWSLGMANFFFQARTSNGLATFICYSEYAEVGPSAWSRSERMIHCPTSQIIGKQLAFRSACGRVVHLALSHEAAAAWAIGP